MIGTTVRVFLAIAYPTKAIGVLFNIISLDMNLCRNSIEKQRFSTESSRPSSSRSSSSFSSADYCKPTQPNPSHNDRITFSQLAPFENSRRSLSPKIPNKSIDFRDVVKDSIVRESKVLSIKTSNHSKPADEEATIKLKQLHGAELSSHPSETRRLSFDSRDIFSTSKIKDLPRLSLDGKECLMRQTDTDSSSNQLQRTPNVIAKLMGLTPLPDQSFIRTHNGRDGFDDPIDTRNSTVSDKWLISEMKSISSSRISIESAPWKSHEKGTTLIKHSSRQIRTPARDYSEIEKRFKDIEFTQSGKDLRALKQILKSIHAKGLKEEEQQKQGSNFTLIKPKLNNASKNQHDTQSMILISKPKSSRSPRSQTSKNMYNDHVVSSNEKRKAIQQQLKDNSASSPRKLGSTSQRTRLKKLESEQQNQSPRSSSDASKHKVPVSKQQTEISTSPGRKVPPKIITYKELNNSRSRKASKEVTLAEGYKVIESEISRKKLLSVDRLVQKLKQLNSNHDEITTDYIAMLCDTTTNPDHRYITEILLASGLLLQEFSSDPKLVHLHNSGFLNNPAELFNVLEETKSNAHTSSNTNRSQRRLVFDTINELLTKNLGNYAVKYQHRLAKKAITRQNLIKEVCGEMEQLSSKKKKNDQENKNMESENESDVIKDLLREDKMWNVFDGKMMSEVVLEIERGLFKKLVNEIVVISYTEFRLVRQKSRNRHNNMFMK